MNLHVHLLVHLPINLPVILPVNLFLHIHLSVIIRGPIVLVVIIPGLVSLLATADQALDRLGRGGLGHFAD